MQYSPQASQPSTLTAEFITLIQRSKEEMLGSLPPIESGSFLSTFRIGLESLASLISATVSATAISDKVLAELDWSDGTVDIPAQVAAVTKKVILDVIEEFGKDQ